MEVISIIMVGIVIVAVTVLFMRPDKTTQLVDKAYKNYSRRIPSLLNLAFLPDQSTLSNEQKRLIASLTDETNSSNVNDTMIPPCYFKLFSLLLLLESCACFLASSIFFSFGETSALTASASESTLATASIRFLAFLPAWMPHSFVPFLYSL